MFVKRIEEVCGEVVEIVRCTTCDRDLKDEEYNGETGTWTCTCCEDESEDDYNIEVIDEREDYARLMEKATQKKPQTLLGMANDDTLEG